MAESAVEQSATQASVTGPGSGETFVSDEYSPRDGTLPIDWTPEDAPECAWFALCDREATLLVVHPAFPSGVPTCERCYERSQSQRG